MPAVTSGPLLKLPSPTLLERRGPRTFLRSKQSNMGRGAATKAAFGAVPAAPVPRFPASTTAPTIRNGPSLQETARFCFIGNLAGHVILRGRAPFSCGKKRALPLKLPLPPKTAHGKARSTRLPSSRTKKRKAGKRQQKCRPKGVRHTGPASSLPAGTACHIMLYIPETAKHQAPSTAARLA